MKAGNVENKRKLQRRCELEEPPRRRRRRREGDSVAQQDVRLDFDFEMKRFTSQITWGVRV